MKFIVGQKYKNRISGRVVKILHVGNQMAFYTVIDPGATRIKRDTESVLPVSNTEAWEHQRDIKTLPVLWFNIYPNNRACGFDSEKEAEKAQVATIIARVPVTIEYYEGQGLNDKTD